MEKAGLLVFADPTVDRQYRDLLVNAMHVEIADTLNHGAQVRVWFEAPADEIRAEGAGVLEAIAAAHGTLTRRLAIAKAAKVRRS